MKIPPKYYRILSPLIYGSFLYSLILLIPNSLDFIERQYRFVHHLILILVGGLFLELYHFWRYYVEKKISLEHQTLARGLTQMSGGVFLSILLAYSLILLNPYHLQETLYIGSDEAPEIFSYALRSRQYIIFISVGLLYQLVLMSKEFLDQYRLKAQEVEEIRKLTALNQLHRLKIKIQPQFWFNCLNTLIQLVHEDPRTSEIFIKKLAHFYRYSLNNDEKDLIALPEEISFLENYLYLLNAGRQIPIHLSLSDAASLNSWFIPSRSIQKLLENWLGQESERPEFSLSLTLSLERQHLRLGWASDSAPNLALKSPNPLFQKMNEIYSYYTDERIQIEHAHIMFPLLSLSSEMDYENTNH